MGRNESGSGLEYGKIKFYSASETVDKLATKLDEILKRWGYPEADEQLPDTKSQSPGKSIDETIAEAEEEEDKVAALTSEDPADDADEPETEGEGPWLAALRKRKELLDDAEKRGGN